MCAEEFSFQSDCLRHKTLLPQSCASDHRGLAQIWDSWPDAAASAIFNFSCSPCYDFCCFRRHLIDATVHSQMMAWEPPWGFSYCVKTVLSQRWKCYNAVSRNGVASVNFLLQRNELLITHLKTREKLKAVLCLFILVPEISSVTSCDWPVQGLDGYKPYTNKKISSTVDLGGGAVTQTVV